MSSELSGLVSTVTQKGQITIPLTMRRLLGVKPKDKVAFTLEEKSVKIHPVGTVRESFQAIPALKRSHSENEIEDIVREEQTQQAASEG